ncbi:MAG: hypothetical protein EPO65_07150 [Dehalococcoidia bacterium]|nr:MAG: hypothetical protein EPO65_07150 [Dehalococcoidia bacterium]
MTQDGSIREQFIIGLDDTDIEGSPGTGDLARALAVYVAHEGWGSSLGVTRHELMRTDKIKDTGHNYCYALGIETDRSVLDLEDDLVAYLRKAAAKGSDPGLSIMGRHADLPHVLAFGRRCQTEIMRLEWAMTFSNEANVSLRALGRDRRGAVGALAAAGLRAGGADGRFIDLRGIRELEGVVTAGQMRERTDIDLIISEAGEPIDRDDRIDTFGWIRPRLEGGKSVVRCSQSPDDRRLWRPLDRKWGEDVDG